MEKYSIKKNKRKIHTDENEKAEGGVLEGVHSFWRHRNSSCFVNGQRGSKPESTPEIQICEGHREAILSKKNLNCMYTPLKTYINALLLPAINRYLN